MSSKNPTYQELKAKLAEAEEIISALRNEEVDAVIGKNRLLLLRLKEVEEALRESEELQRITLENIQDPIFITDSNGKFTFICPNNLHILGYSVAEIEAMGNISVFMGENQSLFDLEDLNRLGEIPNIEAVVANKNGTKRNYLVNVKRVSIKGGTILYVCRDITERKQAEEALRNSEALKNAIIESSPDCIKLLDLEGNLTYMNKGGQEKLEIKDITVYLNKKNWTDFWQGKDDIKARMALDTAVKGAIGNFQGYSPTETGTPRLWDVIISPIWGSNGEVERLLAVSRDITEQKQMADHLLQAQKMEAIGTLAGGIAHDYNNLLAIIMGNLSMAQEEIEPHSAMAELLHEIEQASCKARDLTHQFLTLSQGGYPRKEWGSIESLLKAVRGQARAYEGIEYTLSIQDDLWPVEFDSIQMHYAISNVLTNAVEAMPQGGKIAIETKNQVIEDKSKDSTSPLDEGKYVKISIKDEGRGIPEKHLNRIFDPYFSTKERGVQKGMGLGLATAYAIVEKHGGHIMLNSTTGVGTTATIYLPVAVERRKRQRAKHKSVDIAPSISSGQLTTKRILVMDDEESLRILAQKMLERLGHEVETVKDGVEAIETYEKHMDSGEPFDGVILDLTIKGGMGGEQTIRELMKIDPNVKAVVCSGYFNDPVLAHFEEYGFRGAMAKPYQKDDLESVLKTIL